VSDALALAPAALFDASGRLCDGRWRGPVAEVDLRLGAVERRLRQKEWHYLSFATDDRLVAVAVAQLGYAASLFAYVARSDGAMWQCEALAPLGSGLAFAAAPRRGATVWQRGDQRLRIDATASGWRCEIDLTLSGSAGSRRLRGTGEATADGGLSLIHTLAGDRPAYTHKEAGLGGRIELRLGDELLCGDAVATSDWTRSHALPTTRWRWASLAARLPDGRRFGLNLSTDVYDDASGHGRENAVFVDGAVHLLPGVRFAVPRRPAAEPWHVTALAQQGIDLTFVPAGARSQHVNLGLVESRFVQPFGRWRGAIGVDGARLDIDGLGVAEDHLARW